MTTPRRLIVNADDFGLSPGVNAGIAAAHENGILTSASLMVRWPAAVEAADYARSHPRLSVGLHLDFGEWTFENGAWHMAYQVIPPEAPPETVANELARQLQLFRDLMGREPTHLDSHQHVHQGEPIRPICSKVAQAQDIVLRSTGTDIRYCGDFYGQSNTGYPYPEGISVAALVRVLQNLPAGVTELGCHPAIVADMKGMYRNERVLECETLCHPEILSTVMTEGISLCSFSNWRD